jgi:hypothetical protein
MADLAFEVDADLHQISGALEIARLLIGQSQVPAGI